MKIFLQFGTKTYVYLQYRNEEGISNKGLQSAGDAAVGSIKGKGMLKVNSNNWPPFRQVQPTTFMSGQLAHRTYVLVSTLAQAGFVEFIGVHVTTKRYTSVIAGAMPLLCTLGQKNKFFLSPQFLSDKGLQCIQSQTLD